MNHIVSRVVIAVALAAAVTFWLFRSESGTAARPTAGQNVIVFGDSLAEGRGATPGHSFVAVLSRRLGTPIINAGRSGDTTAAALARLDRAVLDRSPRVVVVLLGGNDFLRRVPPETTFANLATIVERIRERGAAVVLAGVNAGLVGDAYGDEYEAIARQYRTAYVPDILDGIIGQVDLMSDSIHPNDRGYEIMADRIEPALRDLLAGD